MKLRKLILSGFKSFADKTEFDFDSGISCIVGPNGCGKSNVVDAIKWVLGEQSAKSLRGTEMMDVIFNGSTARKPAGGAEVTLLFDNSEGLLKPAGMGDTAPATVAITRRLFRSGQSDYLINKSPSRLKDIREMFMDTGVDAYSVIEQGRVEGFLQASQDDRRAIFDEAAGISKYKARKKEAMRKLERVEQNLLRVNDIVQEVEKRLRSIKYQAGKARNYQGYVERLKELRGLHFLAQYHNLSKQRTELRGKVDAGTDELASINSRIDQLESARSSTEAEATDLDRTSREVQGKISTISSQISTCRQRAEMMTARVKELAEQVVASTRRCQELESKIEGLTRGYSERQGQMQQLEAASAELNKQYEAIRSEHHKGELGIAQLQAQLEDEKAGTIDLLRRTAQLHNEVHGLGIRRENMNGQKSRLAKRAEEIEGQLSHVLTGKAQYEIKLRDVRSVLDEGRNKLDEARDASKRVSDSEQQLRNQLGETREQRSGVLSRLHALREMQQRMEGVSTGVKKVLQAHKAGRLKAIRGIVGEFLQTDVSHAPLLEAALAGADQQLVVDKVDELSASQKEINDILAKSGTVEFLCLDCVPAVQSDLDLSIIGEAAGVIGRMIDFVLCESWLAPAMWQLLGKTLLVSSLADAARAAALLPAGLRYVTTTGEVLEADGRVRVGAGNHTAGVITRRSELAELETKQAALDEQIASLQDKCQTTRLEREHLEEVQQKLRTAIYEANTQRVECESKLNQYSEQVERLEREKPLLSRDIEQLAAQIEASIQQEQVARAKAAELEALNVQRQQQVEKFTQEISAARQHQNELTGQMTEVKVSLAQTEEKRRGLRDHLIAIKRQSEQMQQEVGSSRSAIELNRQRKTDAETAITTAQQEAEKLQAQQAELQQESADLEESRQGLQQRLEEIRKQVSDHRKGQEQIASSLNGRKVELSEADVRIENLITRATDEMQMDLLEQFKGYQHDETRDWQAVEEEIKDLRSKIERLGNVNLDSISEQEELEQREKFLSEQMTDISSSKNQLDELIRKINKESTDLFIQTFELVRKNFQELFRKLFGGGKADILLSNPEDVLESGIEIIARPPGKETRSLTLLSGGEKTMTALSLLFSIFKSRPSPFCLLDEVDAALDEANTERFSRLLQEFMQESQFITISHSKRTMSMAGVLYGVTMQEPGVSKRISVKFEDAGRKSDEQLEPATA